MRIKNLPSILSMDGSQDALVIEQTDGSEDKSRKVSPAQIKQYVLDGVTETSEQYAECSTARNVAAKTVTLPGFKLETGARISVRFTNTGTSNPASGNLTLNVNGTGAKEIVDGHTNMTKMTYTSNWFYNNLVNDFVYDGTYWVWMNRDNNTTYTSKAAASGGTATSLCTTGEKYTWNNKQNALTFDNVPTQNSNNPVKSGGVYTALTLHDNATVQQLNIYKVNNTVSIYGLLSNLDSTQTIIAYATLDAKYRPASGYAIGVLFSTTVPYLPVGSIWIHGSTGLVSIYKEAARTGGYLYMTYLT